MQHSESIKDITKALASAQTEIECAVKDSLNPAFKSKYANLAAVDAACRPSLSKRGIAIIQSSTYADGIAHVTTMLAHESGEWFRSTASAPVSKQDAQGIGSATTYLRRYGLMAMAGVAPDDDDGNASVGSPAAPSRPANQQAAPLPPRADSKPPAGALVAPSYSLDYEPKTLGEARDWCKQHAAVCQFPPASSWYETATGDQLKTLRAEILSASGKVK